MAFSEKLKKEVRMKSDVRCAMCHDCIVEIHHIIPQSENGPDTFDNAVALCASCHFKYGNNPDLRKQIKEMRDSWYEIVAAKKQIKNTVYEKPIYLPKSDEIDSNMIAVYHVVYENESFNDAVQDLVELTYKTTKEYPNRKRVLYLDIDGHRNNKGGFDDDMYELQKNFILDNLIYYYTEVNLPLVRVKNKYKQLDNFDIKKIKIIDNVPDDLKDHEGSILYERKEDEDDNE